MLDTNFVHLRVHSDYSMLDGLNKVKPLIAHVKSLNMPAVAITDQMNMCGLVKFYSQAHDNGIKPIIGTDVWVQSQELEDTLFRLTLLAQNNIGYKNITLLISKAYQRGVIKDRAVIDRDWLIEHREGVIVLSGARSGDLGMVLTKGNVDTANKITAFYQQHFAERYYVELIRTGRPGEEDYIHRAVDWAIENDFPVVATNEVCFIKKEGFDAHEIRVAIHDGYTLNDPRRPKQYSEQQYLRSAEEMTLLFEDIPEALQNTVEIAKRCNVTVTLGEYFLPKFPTGGISDGDYLVNVSQQGLENRLEFLFTDEQKRATQNH